MSYASNVDPGTGYVIITGIPENGYAGSRRVSFKITAPKSAKAGAYDISEAKDTEHRITVTCDSPTSFMKGGAKPAVTVTYTDKEGRVRTLAEGRDYKLSFRNNTSLSGGKSPAAVVTGMGDFKGKRECTFAISEKSLDKVILLADDVAFKNKANSFVTKLTLTDEDEKALKAGKDYEKIPEYTYVNDTEVTSGGSAVTRTAGEKVDKTDIIPVLTYTGKPINLNKSDIKVSIKGTTLGEDDYDIVSYSNNTQKGSAKVTLRGKGNYGGLKTQTFKIKAKGFKWWWRK